MCQTVIFVSYLAEMVDTDGKLKIGYVKDESNVLKLKVPSRPISRTTYRFFLRYLSKIFKPAEILSDVFKKNNYIPVIESDSDND